MEPSPKDVVVAILSLATREGKNKFKPSSLFEAFAKLKKEFGNQLGSILIQDGADYSKQLDSILSSIVGYGLDVTILNELKMQTDTAERNISRLWGKYGREFLDDLLPIARRLIVLTSA